MRFFYVFFFPLMEIFWTSSKDMNHTFCWKKYGFSLPLKIYETNFFTHIFSELSQRRLILVPNCHDWLNKPKEEVKRRNGKLKRIIFFPKKSTNYGSIFFNIPAWLLNMKSSSDWLAKARSSRPKGRSCRWKNSCN